MECATGTPGSRSCGRQLVCRAANRASDDADFYLGHFSCGSSWFQRLDLAGRPQARLALEQNRTTEAQKLKLEIYQTAAAACRICMERVVEHSMAYQSLKTHLVGQSVVAKHGLQPSPPRQSFADFREARYNAHVAILELIFTVEKWRVVQPRLDLFHTALNVGLTDWEVATDGLTDDLRAVLSWGQAPWVLPAEDQERSFRAHLDDLIHASDRLNDFVQDFLVELQNLLVSDLFMRRVPYREPIDPARYATRLDRYDELMKRFDQETTFGKRRKHFMDLARAASAKEPGSK